MKSESWGVASIASKALLWGVLPFALNGNEVVAATNASMRTGMWLVAGAWAGPAGLSLLGLDYEGEIRPCAGDVVPCRSFDGCTWTNWTAVAYEPGKGYVIHEKAGNSTWAKSASYAFSYVTSDAEKSVRLVVAHRGRWTQLFVNGSKLMPAKTRHLKSGRQKGLGTTDQGNTFDVVFEAGGVEDEFNVPLVKGVNRILVKMVRQDPGGDALAFDAAWRGGEIEASVADPETDAAMHAALGRMWAKVDVSATANLPHPGDVLDVTTAINFPWKPTPRAKKGRPRSASEPLPAGCPFAANVEQVVRDYDGREVARASYPIMVPGTNSAPLCVAGEVGYYSIHTTVKDGEGRVLFAFPSDGFSVISPVEVKVRPFPRKIATCHYWINEKNMGAIFDWMDRIGIRHNVGGAVGATNLFIEAKRRGLTLTADFLDPWSTEKPEAKRAKAVAAAQYTALFKSLNEIDIARRWRTTPERWTARTRVEYEAVKAANPDAIYTGASLVRPGTMTWFDECLTNGIYDCVDAWDVHAYPCRQPRFSDRHLFNSPNESGPGVEKCVLRTLGRENDKKFIMGETGARCSHGWDARRWQADMVAKIAAWGVASTNYLQIAFLVPWNKSESGGDIPVAHYPAEAALATAARLVDGKTYTPIDGLPKGVEAGRFGNTLMLWAAGGGAIDVVLKADVLPGARDAPLSKVDVVGRRCSISRSEDGSVRLSLSSSPIYIETSRKDCAMIPPHEQ